MTEIIEKIIDILREKNEISVNELTELLPFSENDIKKVITMLSETGKINLTENIIISLSEHTADNSKDIIEHIISDESFNKIKGLIDNNAKDWFKHYKIKNPYYPEKE